MKRPPDEEDREALTMAAIVLLIASGATFCLAAWGAAGLAVYLATLGILLLALSR